MFGYLQKLKTRSYRNKIDQHHILLKILKKKLYDKIFKLN